MTYARRSTTWLWILCALFAVGFLLWRGRRVARVQHPIARDLLKRPRAGFGRPGGIDRRRELRAIEDFGCAVAPLVLFALMWLLAGWRNRPPAQVRGDAE
jgi:hypothetical protein